MKNVMMFNDDDIETMRKQVEAENAKSGGDDDLGV